MHRRLLRLNSNLKYNNKSTLSTLTRLNSSKSKNATKLVENEFDTENVFKAESSTDLDKTSKVKLKPVKNEPFVKNLFVGKYIYDYIKYPEYDNNYELNNLNNLHIGPLKDYFGKVERSKVISGTNFIPLDKFNQLGLFGQSLPKEYNGLDLDVTSVTRALEECAAQGYPGLAMHLIYSNEIAAKSIRVYGNDKQREKYLKRLNGGELRAGFGYSEINSGMDASRFTLKATRSASNSDVYLLNGSKCWVSLLTSTANRSDNGDFVLVVVAKTIQDLDDKLSLTAFIVDANTPGITLKKKKIDGMSLYEVDFKDVKVNASESVLGAIGAGHEIANRMMDEARFLVGAVCVGMLKKIYKQTIDYCIWSKRFDKSLTDHLAIKNRIASIETRLYVMESVVYLTAGIIDSYQTPDISLESSLAKIICTENLRHCLSDCNDIMAMGVYNNSDLLDNMNMVNLLMNMLTTNDVLRLQVATQGVLMAGIDFGHDIVKHRNPFMFPAFVFKKIVANYRLMKSIKKKLPEYFFLWEHVHPALNDQASLLEQAAVKFMLAVKSSLINHGRDIVDYQICLWNLSEIALNIYGMNAAIARASRSYSIGLANASHEMALTQIQCLESNKIVDEIYKGVLNSGIGHNFENTRLNIADKVFNAKEHAATHALTRNY